MKNIKKAWVWNSIRLGVYTCCLQLEATTSFHSLDVPEAAHHAPEPRSKGAR